MYKMCRRILGNKQGMITVEMSALMPLILLLSAGTLLLSLFLLDMAAVKGFCIYTAKEAAQDSAAAQENLRRRLTDRLSVSELENCEVVEGGYTRRITISLTMKWPWKGLEPYMGKQLQFHAVTRGGKDYRKQWRWLKDAGE